MVILSTVIGSLGEKSRDGASERQTEMRGEKGEGMRGSRISAKQAGFVLSIV
jgi:hypothetical protein